MGEREREREREKIKLCEDAIKSNLTEESNPIVTHRAQEI